MASNYPLAANVVFKNPRAPEDYADILTSEVVEFVTSLQRTFNAERERLLAEREVRQARFEQRIREGKFPVDFLSGDDICRDEKGVDIRTSDWKVAPVPKDIQRRRVEITGPARRKMLILAGNSGADVHMADIEDSETPSFENVADALRNLRDRQNRTISFPDPKRGDIKLNDDSATLFLRPRGWHLLESHVEIDGKPMSGAFFDFGAYFTMNKDIFLERVTKSLPGGPYFYLPKMESYLEARLWAKVFEYTEARYGFPKGSIKATVLIETFPAVFQMDEILYELRNYSAGLNAGRWDYIFSFIKTTSLASIYYLPDRATVNMATPMMRSYAELLVNTCHKRGAFAIGGMSAFIPVRSVVMLGSFVNSAVDAAKSETLAKALLSAGLISDKGVVADKYSSASAEAKKELVAAALAGQSAEIVNHVYTVFTKISDAHAACQAALSKVREDKTREATIGCDGAWVAHPDLVPVAMEVFKAQLGDRQNQLSAINPSLHVATADLYACPNRKITHHGIRVNARVAIKYLEAWFRGNGAVAIDNLMEDAATAEISRTQLWQWIRDGLVAEWGDGSVKKITKELVREIMAQEKERIIREDSAVIDRKFLDLAAEIIDDVVCGSRSGKLEPFITTIAYDKLLETEGITPKPKIQLDDEDSVYEDLLRKKQSFLASDRFKHLKRPYKAEDVLDLQGTFPNLELPSNIQARKLWKMLQEYRRTGKYSITFGCLDPVQVAQMSKYLTSIYISGWQSSSTASSNNMPGPDLADYPYDTIPKKADQLFRAQLFHDKKQQEERRRMTPEQRRNTPKIDFMRPIIADADAGHGGVTAVAKLTRMFIEAGAAGIHLEDQRTSAKKCGHLGGKVLVSCQEFIDRLCAARLSADMADSELVIVARTDAEAATLLDNNGDARDHPYILGSTNAAIGSLNDAVAAAQARGESTDAASGAWTKAANLKTLPQLIAEAILASALPNKEAVKNQWMIEAMKMSISQMRARAVEILGESAMALHWDMEAPRVREGFYQIEGGVPMCIARAIHFAPYSDLIWMESKNPSLDEAREFAEGVLHAVPDKLLAYNLSPSFNWDAAGMNEAELAVYTDKLGELGYVWQFITLAGFHSDALIIDQFAKGLSERKMLAYVEMVQRQERIHKVETLTHQKWSGAEYTDRVLSTAVGGVVSTKATGSGLTETQFTSGTVSKH